LLERRERLYRGKRERRQLPSLMEWRRFAGMCHADAGPCPSSR
jgi:hypothetical protein